MDLDRFRELVTNPARTRDELKNMLANAIQKGAREHAAIAKGELDRRFPGWEKIQSKRGGSKPAVATFQGRVEHFPTTKEAYVWLVERFTYAKPDLFSDPSKETVAVAVGRDRNYFARSPEKLFRETPELAENSSNFVRLSNGWFANLNLNNAQKFSILARLSWVTGVEYPESWNLDVLDATESLKVRKQLETIVRDIMKELGGGKAAAV